MLKFNFYLKDIEYRILNHEDIDNLDKVLVMEFKRALKDIEDNWEEYQSYFIEGINYVFSYEEQMVFIILTSKLGMDFLTKDFEYSSELITALLHSDKLVLNYDKYASLFYQGPFYEMITNLINDSKLISYYFIFKCILNNIDSYLLDEANYNLITSMLMKISGQDYHVLLSKEDTLFTIYQKIREMMQKENQGKLIYSRKDYERLKTILLIIKENEKDKMDSLAKELIEIDSKEIRKNDVIRSILKKMDEETLLVRRKYDKS